MRCFRVSQRKICQYYHGITPFEYRSSRSEIFFKIGALKNFAIFTGKHLRWSLLFNKVASLQDCNFVKRRLQLRGFPVSLWRLLLKILRPKNIVLSLSVGILGKDVTLICKPKTILRITRR